jgi:hypothetical protein
MKTHENLGLVFYLPTILQQLLSYNSYFHVAPIVIYRFEKRIRTPTNIL